MELKDTKKDPLKEAYNLLDKKDVERSLNIFNKILLENPKLKSALIGKAICLNILDKSEQSKGILKKVLEIDKSYIPALGILGDFYLYEGRYQKAKKNFEKIIKKDPKNVMALNRMGRYFSGIRRYTQSIQYFKKAIRLNPKNASFLSDLGFAYFERKDYNKAKRYFMSSIELDKKNIISLLTLFKIYNKKGESEKEGKTIDKLLGLKEVTKEGKAILLMHKGILSIKKERYEEAIKFLNRSIKLDPEHECPRIYKVETLIKLKKIREAKRMVKEISSKEPKVKRQIKKLKERVLKISSKR